QQRNYLSILNINRNKFKKWSDLCSDNFEHKFLLISAELAHFEGETLKAMRHYQDAIQSAYKNEFIQCAGISCEMAAYFYFRLGYESIGHSYLTEAIQCYVRWQATAKVKQIDQLYPFLTKSHESTHTSSIATDTLEIDLLSVLKSSQYISESLTSEEL